MKPIKLTNSLLKSIKPSTIIYAEFAHEGAMGACGTARIVTLEDGKLKFYLVDGISDGEASASVYSETISLLKTLAESDKLQAADAGFGNYAFKSPKVIFTRDDDNYAYIYKKDAKTYKIPASCQGVYEHSVAQFAKRQVSIEELEEFFNKEWPNMNGGECWFFQNYLQQIKRKDSGQGWFDFTAIDYLNAVGCLKHLHGDDYILNSDDVADGFAALFKYRLRDVADKIGWTKLDKTIAQMVKAGKIDLFARLEKQIGEPVETIYDELKVVKSGRTSLSATDPDNIENLINAPILVDFSKATHAKIIQDIMDRSGNSFNPDAKSVALYLANYMLNEDKLPLSDVLPAVAHIVEVLPSDDFNNTHTDELFWLCGAILDKAWRYLEEDEATQRKYRDLMYELYWPRVGSLWPVLHRGDFDFKYESAGKIFDDSLSFVMSLEDITERNHEIKAFLDQNAEHIGYNAGPLGRRAFVYTLRNLKSKQEFERILEAIEPQDYHSYLSYPNKIEDAEILMRELFRTDDEARIREVCRLQVLESLLITPNTIGVGEYILNYIDEHFDDFVSLVSTEAITLGAEPTSVLEDFFVAMSKGITEENEFPAFKSIEAKLRSPKYGLDCNAQKLSDAAKYARKHRRTILFQRSALQKLF